MLKSTQNISTLFKRFFSEKHCTQIPLANVINDFTSRFNAENIPDAASSTEFIIAHVLGRKTLHDVNIETTTLNQTAVTMITKLCNLRLQRMPVQYIIKEWDFQNFTLQMNPPVFIPRPETEELVDYCKEILESDKKCYEQNQSSSFVEVGCGSGAISLALLDHFEQLNSVCIEISPSACNLTKANAKMNGLQDRLHVINQDFTQSAALSQLHLLRPFSFLVSNPPYVTSQEMKDLAPEISRFEDPVALHGGVDGLDIVRPILQHAAHLLVPHGHVFLEVGECHCELIQQHVNDTPSLRLDYVETRKDLFNKNRFCHLQVKPS